MTKTLRAFGFAILVAVAAVLAFGPVTAQAAPTFPALTGRVVDDAHVLSAAQKAELDQKLASLESSTHRQLVVATLASLNGYEISDYGYQLGRAWKIGRAGSNDGAVFIVAPNEHKVRIEVGYGLEPVLTDAMSSLILQRAVLPKFKAGDIPGGVMAGTDAIIDQLNLPEDQAKANVAQAETAPVATVKRHHSSPFAGIPVLLIFFFIFMMLRAGGRRGGRGGGGLASALPWMILGSLANSGGRGSDWSGGGGGGFGGGGGGGGFSGGGGSFGGGGSSGSW